MPDYGMTIAGFRAMTEDEIYEDIMAGYRAQFGITIGSTVYDVFERNARTQAEALYKLWQNDEAIWQSISPSDAEGVPLDNAVKLVAVEREDSTKSRAFVTCFGTPATVLTVGRLVQSDLGKDFALVTQVVIAASGSIVGTFDAVDEGAVKANAGTIQTIKTAVAGWTSCINYTDANIGQEIQTDTSLRKARDTKIRTASTSTYDAMATGLTHPTYGVGGITDLLVVQNETGETQDSIPGHYFEVILLGGDDGEIVQKIWDLKPNGIKSYGSSSDTAIDYQGDSRTEYFTRPADVECHLHLILTVTDDFDRGRAQQDKITVDSVQTGAYTVTINGVAFTYQAITTGSVSAFADAGGGQVTVTSAAHNLVNGAAITISGTANYDGAYVISGVTTSSFEITAAWVATETGTWTKTGGADDTTTIALGLSALINGTPWVPVTSAHTGGNAYFELSGDYRGAPYSMTATPITLMTVSTADFVSAEGDQSLVTDAIMAFAEGSATIVKEQKIGVDVLLFKYAGQAGTIDNIIGVVIYAAGSQPNDPPDLPLVAPWSANDIAVTIRQIAQLDSTRITMELLP